MLSIKLAQQAVAVEACKRLHECGELDDNFMPIGELQVANKQQYLCTVTEYFFCLNLTFRIIKLQQYNITYR